MFAKWYSAARFIILLVAMSWAFLASGQQPDSSATGFAGKYSELRPQQKRLVNDWFARFSEVVKKPIRPEEGYEMLPLSVKTTFNAVTHALIMTTLTDSGGEKLVESAIDLVDRVDRVAGEVLGERGDRQFRIYVQMKPGAVDRLRQSQEFRRAPDNTVFHKGYPICFRSVPSSPSIQVSLARDATRADIDVDYRSARFPVFLINGHLSASNSDVRASNNDERHNGRWVGLQNWWRNLLGLPLLEGLQERGPVEEGAIPRQPTVKHRRAADAVHHFLNTWLVDQKPNESIPYFANQAYACIELERGGRVDMGMVKFQLLHAMQELNRQAGPVATLSDATLGARLTGERVRVIEQPYHAQFVLYDVREDLAEQFNCLNRLDTAQISPKNLKSKAFGKYVGAVFRLKAKDQNGETIATLWQKEGDYWKMISYKVEPQFDQSRVPDVSVASAAEAPLSEVPGDKDMVAAARSFFQEWLVRRNVEKAVDFLAPECLDCFNLYRSDELPEANTPEMARRLLGEGMRRIVAPIPRFNRLEEVIVAAEPHHQDLKLVRHPAEKAFAVVSIPQYMADAVNCQRRKPGVEPEFSRVEAAGYGKYYATGLSLANALEQPSVLWIVWGKANGSWKGISYAVMTP